MYQNCYLSVSSEPFFLNLNGRSFYFLNFLSIYNKQGSAMYKNIQTKTIIKKNYYKKWI